MTNDLHVSIVTSLHLSFSGHALCPACKVLYSFALPGNPPHPTGRGGWWAGWGGGGFVTLLDLCVFHSICRAYPTADQQHIHSISTAYSQISHSISPSYSQNVHSISTAYPQHIHSISTAYPQYIHSFALRASICVSSFLCVYIYIYIYMSGV